mmetsp:Transcript_63891/g.150025  ORF Transcript_63891/g.150025 Transcript_63891/m.150025 type:complete len:385 (-) Transcript_63891:96-1250(-)
MTGGAGFGREFLGLCDANNGVALHKLFQGTRGTLPTELDLEGVKKDAVASSLATAWKAGETPGGLEALLAALRHWSARYVERNDKVRWMLAPMLWIAARTRQVAVKLDKKDLSRNRGKVVEEVRLLFTKLHQDRARREGALVMCCELLRLYKSLGQASQCSFILTAVGNVSREEKFDSGVLPKSLLVTLYFLWGQHLVLEGKIVEAQEKLSQALVLCPPKAAGNRRRILAYLIPCRLRMGRYPARGVLERNGLVSLTGLVVATATGSVRRFNEELLRQEAQLIDLGTYLVMEKLKVVAYRNLTRRVFEHQCALLEGDKKAKQDFAPYECAFRWQDDCSEDETLCLLAHMIYIGAVKGYLSDAHRKVVFSKETPFPPTSAWASRA